MTHQNHQTNGASLEDCHTNFYALTDLCGIKWKKFVNGERPSASSDPLADPILRSYSRCIQADMLCVWRRVQSTKTDNADPNALTFEITTSTKVHPPLSLAAAKELWIFWYGEEPDFTDLVDAELLRVAANQALWNGTWKGALTYECRSLLFKALHNLMERFVLTKDIVRFGKWFVQPCTSSDRLFGRSSQHLSFSFTFFVHGDTVCASIDLREHPAVRPLTKEHLAEAAAAFAAASSPPGSAGSAASAGGGAVPNPGQDPNGAGMDPLDGGEGAAKAAPPAHARKVMLAPFGIAAILTGNSYKASDPNAEKILEDWASFFPLCNKDNTDVPPVVEVVSGGHKMYHPTNYVLVTDLDDMEHMEFVEMQKMQSSMGGAPAEAAVMASLSCPPSTAAGPTNLGAAPSATAIPVGPASLNAPGGGGAPGATATSAAKEVSRKAATQAVSAMERIAFQPYYDQRPTSGFTFNTNNTHIPASAAVEMPERTWQDCVKNTLHVDAAAAAAAAAAASSSSSSTPASGAATSGDNDENEQNKPPQQDSKQMVQQQIQQQQQQQRQKLWNFVDPMQKAPCICTKHLGNTPHGTPHGGASTYSRNSLGGDSSMPVASVESPATPAPSPHPNSAHSQPTSVPPAEQLLNMSPHAPTSVSNLQQPPTPIDHLLDKNTPAPTPTDQHDNKSITASPYVHQTPSVEPPSYTDHAAGGGTAGVQSLGTGPGSVPAQQPATPTAATSAGGAGPGGASNVVGGAAVGTISVKKLEMQQQNPTAAMAIKQEPGTQGRNASGVMSTAEARNNLRRLYNPPKLTLKDPDSFYDDEWLKVIYDFQYQENWDYLTVKRPKLDKQRRPRYAKNLYEGHTHVKPLMPSPGSVYGSQLLSLDVSATSAGVGGSAAGSSSGGLVGIANSTANGSDAETETGSSFFQGLDIKTEPGLHSPSCKETSKSSGGGNSSGGGSGSGGNLFTAEGLNPSLNDLEQLFETSSNDECSSVQIHTPPDSNNPSNGGCSAVTNTIEDLKRSTAVTSAAVVAAAAAAAASGAGNIQAEDLTKMFPTPPSHEQQHPNSSPCQTDVVMTDLSVDTTTTSITSSSITTTCSNTTITSSINTTTTGCSNTNSSIILAAVQAPVTVVAIQTVSKLVKQEYNLELGSPVEEPIDDWNYVYRPPQQEKFVGSTRYAPLTNLPSQTQPPLTLPPGCFYQPTWSSPKSRAATLAKAAAAQQQQHQKHQALQQRIQLHQQKLQQLQHQHHQQQQAAAAAAAAAAAGGVGHQKHQHQHLHDLLSAAPRTPLTPSTVPQPLSSGGSQLLLNQLNCPQAPPGSSMQQLMHRAGMSPISPGPGMGPYAARSSPMSRATPTHPPPPYPYDLAVASPATSTSSYLNRPLHSQEHPHMHGMGGGGPGGLGPGTGPGGHMSMMPYTGDAGIASGGTAMTAGPSSLLQELPEVNSVLVNILLYDTALNVFRDHNFDSSSVCVCNADTQKIGNIRGADSGVYVPLPGVSFNPFPTGGGGAGGAASGQRMLNGPSSGGFGGMRMISAFGGSPASASMPGAGSGHGHGPNGGSNSSSCTPPSSNPHITGYVDDDPVECTCGFSAVVNRRLSHRAGLFYEDEVEITGIADDPGRNKQPTLLSIIQSLSRKNQIKQAPGESSSALEKLGAGAAAGAQLEHLAHAVFDLLLDQCSIIQTSSSSVHRALQSHRRRMSRQRRIFGTNGASTASLASIANVLEFMDAHDVISLALEQARLAFENQRMDNIMDFHGNGSSSSHQQQQLTAFHAPPPALRLKLAGIGAGRLTVHKWPYLPVGFTRSNKEIVRTMNAIQPMLQNAFHCKSRGGSGSKDASSYNTVSGPLTWRQFHRLAGRASGQCEPQPIPSVVVGYEKDWISVAPHSIHYWDKFLLEPYSYARDVVYLVVCPDNEHVTACTRSYFRELSSTYEMCKLGKHTPIRGWDGILQVGAARNNVSADRETTPLDDWLRTLEHAALAEQIRRYAVAFIHQLAPYLSRVPNDKTLLNPPDGTGNSNSKGGSSSSSNSSSVTGLPGGDLPTDNIKLEPGTEQPVQPMEANEIKQEPGVGKGTSTAGDTKPALILGDPLGMGETLEDINPSAIVLYVVNPFTFASDSCELERLALIALLRCYAELLKAVPDSVRSQMNIQIISLESVMELGPCGNRKRFSDEIRCLALNIFSQCRRHLVHAQSVKSLTGFGTAANMEAFLKTKDEPNRRAYKMYTAPFVLAPMHERNDKTDFARSAGSMHGQNEHRYSVMYCNYCLSEDQAWLLATATDERGELLEKICINIDVPNRARRRKAPARYVALKKLMDFIMGIISQTSQMWRLVIGRIGRIGHSELKSWSYLLSKQQLQKASKQFKDMCEQCTLMYPPTILSACLVTLEPDAKLRVMPDQFTPDERFSQISMQNPLATPQDVTCTHILVFPTSAVCAPFTRQFQNEPQVEDDFMTFEEEGNEDFSDADIGDFLWDSHIDRVSNHGSPGRMDDNRSWQSAGGNNFKCTPPQEVEEVGSLNQQPISVGYMVSTAPTGRMPAWFWSACPHLEDVCPVFLKTALHLHVPSIQSADDILNSTNAHQSANDHPLDSILTADVLRFVLEGYNALSWLALDSNTHDRLSCLPINVQTLMDLYYLTAAIA